MAKRRIDIVLDWSDIEEAFFASYDVRELTGFRAYTIVQETDDVPLDELEANVLSTLTTLDA